MKRNIVFISDSSINNPIIHSQGIPLLKHLVKKNYYCNLVTFERNNGGANSGFVNSKVENINHAKILLSDNILPHWLQIIVKGIIYVFNFNRTQKIDLIHARSLSPAIIATVSKILFNRRIKVLYDNRGVFIEEEIYKGNWKEKSCKVKLARYFEKLVINKSDYIVVVSNVFKNYLIENFNNLNIKNKIKVIPNRTKIPADIEKKNKEDKIIGIYSGSIVKWQKIEDIINLIKQFLNLNKNLKFVFLTYQDIKLVKSKFNDLTDDKIEFHNLNPADVSEYLKMGSFAILIREKHLLNRVSSPLKFAEYLANGLPVLISEEIGDTENIILKYGVGVIIKNNNYQKAYYDLIKLLNDPNISDKCFLIAKRKFNIEDSFNEYEAIYNFLLT